MPIRVQVGGRVVEFPDGTDEATMAKALQSLPKETPAAAAPQPQHGGGFVDALPTVMGTAFSLAGGSKALPTGVAMAGLGGAFGEGLRQITRAVQGQWDQVPDSIGGQFSKMGREAAGQAVMEGGGRALAGIVKPVAKGVYGLAMRPAKALQKEYGLANIVNQGFNDKVLPNSLGVDRAGKLVGASRDEATAIANKSQVPIKLKAVLQKATDDQAKRAEKELSTAGLTPPIDKIATQIGNVIDSNPEMVTPGRLLELRRGAEDVAAPAFKMARMPGGAGRIPAGTEASVARSMSNAERQTLDDVLGQKFKDVNARTQARSGVLQATKDAASRPNMLTNLIAGGAGASALYDGDVGDAVKRGLLFRSLFSPSAQAGVALAAPAVAKYGPRVLDAASGSQMKDALVAYLMGGQQ